MFPQLAELELDTTDAETARPRGKSFLFDFATGDFVLRDGKMVEATGIDSLKVWIEKALRTAKYRYEIYTGTEYGASTEDLVGSNLPFDFIKEEMKREVREALQNNQEILSVSDLSFEREGSKMTVRFTVNSIFGATQQEVNV